MYGRLATTRSYGPGARRRANPPGATPHAPSIRDGRDVVAGRGGGRCPERSTAWTRAFGRSAARVSAMMPEPGAHVDAASVVGQGQLEDEFHQPLGFRPRHERDGGRRRTPARGTRPCRRRCWSGSPCRAASDEFAQGVEFLVAQRPVEHHVQVHAPLDAQDVGEEKVDVQPRTLDPLVREILRGGFEDLRERSSRRNGQLGPTGRRTQSGNAAFSCRGGGFSVSNGSMSLPAIRHPDAPPGGFYVFEHFRQVRRSASRT